MKSFRELMRRLPPDGQVRDLLRKFNLAPKIDRKARSVKDLALDLGFSVERCDLPRGMVGRLMPDAFAENGYCIEVNKNNSVQAQRFAVLHEIGHFFLHLNRNDPLADPMFLDRSGAVFYDEPTQEREANEFAETVLFGDGALDAARSLYGGSVPSIAQHFGVSEKVVEIAMRRMR
jgi:Zn-dependent peptidase ImmA (M78 family)